MTGPVSGPLVQPRARQVIVIRRFIVSWESQAKPTGVRQREAGKHTLKTSSRFHGGDLPISLEVDPRCLSVRLPTPSSHSQIRRRVVLE